MTAAKRPPLPEVVETRRELCHDVVDHRRERHHGTAVHHGALGQHCERMHDVVEHRRERLHDAMDHSRERLHDAVDHSRERLHDAVDHSREKLHDAVEEIKPHLRGWLHAVTFPLSVVAGVVLFILSPTPETRVSSGVFAVTAALLFGSSTLFHRGRWSTRTRDMLRRIDHASIFLLIAGTYTPFAVLLLEGEAQRLMLFLVWVGALAGIAFRVLWMDAPRWMYVPAYVAMGWAAVFWMNEFAASAQAIVLTLIIAGGLLYSIGGLVYGLQRPNPLPRWFGFHEVFHTLTVIAFFAHYVGVSIATYSLR
ncbi:MAG: PAQR family membrane homeostasis protein TrhA [Nocardioidaceae bacterium]